MARTGVYQTGMGNPTGADILPALADVAPNGSAVDCACINRNGQEVPLGQIACLTVGQTSFLARCAMSQNVLTWRKIGEGCPTARTSPSIIVTAS